MLQQTPNKRVLFRYRLAPVLLVLFGVFSLLAFSLHAPQKVQADSSNTVNFQARLQTASGAIVPDDTYNVQFKLYSGSGCTPATGTGCTQEWTESYQNNAGNGVQVINGYLTVNLGSVTALPTTLDWDQPLYLSMNIGGTTTGTPTYDGEMKPYLKLTAVPYAFQAKSASQLQQLQGSYSGTLNFTTLTDNRSISLPDATGTVCLQSSADCGFLNETTADGRYLQNTAALQTGNIYLQAATSGSVAATLQANASGTGDILDLLDGSGAKVLSVSNAGDIVIKPSDSSLTGFQIQNSSKTIFDVDTTNGRIGINRTDPGYALDVNGDINSTTAVRVGGVSVCTVSNCVPTSGSNNYIQNTTGTQDAANINIRSVASNAVTAVIQGASGQTADILQVEGWDGTSTTQLMNVNSAGDLTAAGAIQGNTINASSGYSYNGTAGATTTCSGGQFLQNINVQGGIVTDGTCASAVSSATLQNVYDNSGSTPIIKLSSTGKGLFIQDAATTVGGNLFAVQSYNDSTSYFAVTTSGTYITGTATVTGGTTLRSGLSLTGTPTASATSSLISIGSAIQGGNANGTYLGLNAASGYSGDFLNFQLNGTKEFSISTSGAYANAYLNGSLTVVSGVSSVAGNGSFYGLQASSGGLSVSGGSVGITGTSGKIGLSGNGVLVKTNAGDNSTAFQIQNSNSKSIFTVDTASTIITLGDSTTGNYITVASTGLTAYGTARHTKTILLPAEYAGAALDAAGDSSCSSANSGSMASGFDTSSRQNFYSWTANTSGTQCYDVVVQVPVPSDFAAWSAAPTLYVANTSSSSSAVCVEAITTGGSIDGNYGGYACTTTGSSLSSVTLPSLNGTYTAGGYLTFKIRLTSTGTTNITKIGNLALQYYTMY